VRESAPRECHGTETTHLAKTSPDPTARFSFRAPIAKWGSTSDVRRRGAKVILELGAIHHSTLMQILHDAEHRRLSMTPENRAAGF
jgi:hypothetical protein